MQPTYHTPFRSTPGLAILCLALLLVLAGLASPPPVEAATCTWTGATSTAWAVATNWDCGAVPGEGDTAVVPNTTNKPVVTTSQSIGTLTIQSGGKVTVSNTGPGVLMAVTSGTVAAGGTIQVDGANGRLTIGPGATFTVDGILELYGSIRGEGSLTLNSGSTFNWRLGGFGNDAYTTPALTVSANGTINLLATSSTWVTYGTQMIVGSTAVVNWTGAGNMSLHRGGVIDNYGAWNVTGSATSIAYGSDALGTLNNYGTFTKSTNASTLTVTAIFNNKSTGIVNANSGTLALAAGGVSESGSTFNVASGATLSLYGRTSTPASPNHTIAGTVQGAGTVSFNTGAHALSGPYNMTGGTTQAAGSGYTATLSNITALGKAS